VFSFSKRGDLATSIAELLLQRGCVEKRTVLKLYNITGEDWKKVKQKVVKLLAVRGVKVYKWSNWTYCISGVKPSGSHEMTIPYCYSLKSTLKQWLSLRSYPEEKALVKQN
jgi:hypothetical protein